MAETEDLAGYDNMFWTRLISGVVLIIIAVVVLWFGGPLTGLVTLFLSLVGVFELCRVYEIEKKAPAILAYIWTTIYYLLLILGRQKVLGIAASDLVVPVMIIYLLIMLVIYVAKFPEYHDKEIMAAFTAFFYVAVMLSYLYRIRTMQNGGYLVILVFVCSWGNDTLAYCVGRLFGKHKMSPVLSPKKSVEGLFGGIIGAGLLGVLYALMLGKHLKPIPHLYIAMFFICAIGAIPAVIGDLAASAIKRNNEIKDYGTLIPGHGGVLDRFDSMIFTAPIIYYLVQFVY